MGIRWNDVYVWTVIALAVVVGVSIAMAGVEKALPTVLTAVLTASVLDVLLTRVLKKRWKAPYSAIITGLIVGAIVAFEDPLYVPMAAATIAIASKKVLKYKFHHIVNPAAFGLLATFLLFSRFDAWWGALNVLVPFLVVIAWKINRLYLPLSFLLVYFILAHFLGNFNIVKAEDLLNFPLFFAFIMAVEPKTTPVKKKEQLAFGILLGIILGILSFVFPIQYALLVSLLIANLVFFGYRIRG